MGEHLIYGAIGFLLGGIIGGYFAGKSFAKQYKGRIEDLQRENDELRKEVREKHEKGLAEREKDVEKAAKKLDRNLNSLHRRSDERGEYHGSLDTATIERLSEEYRSEAFNAHFADRVGPDDSDDVGEDDGRTPVDIPGKMVREYVGEEADPSEEDDDGVQLTDAERQRLRDMGIEIGVVGGGDNDGKISLISEEQFKHDIEVRDCATYTYYREDGVLVDDMTQEVEKDQLGILGKEGMELIDDTEAEVLYINNEPDDMMYEVIVDHKMSYYRDVLGY